MAAKTFLKSALTISVFFVFLAVAGSVHAKIIYVDDDAAGANNGSSWADAYNYLQDALADASSSIKPVEIRVAQGIYKPDQNIADPNGSGDREATFQLINGTTLKGGYLGYGKPDPDTRDIEAYETVLSGDLNGNDGLNFANNDENSYHVFYHKEGMYLSSTAILDGFTVSGGNANGSYPHSEGGGMFNKYNSPIVTNCKFEDNSAIACGGGMYNLYSSPQIINCTFYHNSGGTSGGMRNTRCEPLVANCIFSNNHSIGSPWGRGIGGGISNYAYPAGSQNPTIINCIFAGNTAVENGGGVHNDGASSYVTNCTFSGNIAKGYGSGICNYHHSTTKITNCIFWGNTDDEIYNHYYASPIIIYCDVQGGYGGTSNINVDPCFVQSGYWDANGLWVKGDYRLLIGSPCIDAGDPNYIAEPDERDLDGNPRVIRGRIDMGAYEFQGRRILYVDDDATGANDGSSWEDAYNYMQDALAAAWSGDEIRVAQGTYKPDQGNGITPGDRTATFQLKNVVTIKGGYAGAGTPDPNARDIDAYKTILSGDLAGNDVDVNDLSDLWDEPSRADNSYQVVTASGTNETAVMEGFTITAGNDNRYELFPPPYPHLRPIGHGAGMCNHSGSPTLSNCTFIRNTANNKGGGMCNEDESIPTLTNCIFSENSARAGGAMYTEESSPSLINCTFNGNLATSLGGGVTNYDSFPTLTNCTFSGNSATDEGGGIYNYSSSTNITNCTFIGNSAYLNGGAVCIVGIWFGIADPTLINCEFIGSVARDSGVGMHNTVSSSSILLNCAFIVNSGGNIGGGIWNRPHSNPTLTNCIIWGNKAQYGPQICLSSGCYASVNYSDVQGGEKDVYVGRGCTLIWCEGNIDADPCFVDSGYWGDRYDPNIIVEPNDPNALWVYGDCHLLPGSPCIDAGDPNYVAGPNEMDLDGRPRVIAGRIDMGAYETPIFAEARILPQTINLASKGNWITCYIWIPEQYNVADIDPNSIFLENEIQPVQFSVDEQQQVATVRFNREDILPILEVGDIDLKITGRLTDETVFEGTDTIKVLNKAREK